jgi:hypothetical protein
MLVVELDGGDSHGACAGDRDVFRWSENSGRIQLDNGGLYQSANVVSVFVLFQIETW